MVGPVVGISDRDGDEPPSVALRRADQNPGPQSGYSRSFTPIAPEYCHRSLLWLVRTRSPMVTDFVETSCAKSGFCQREARQAGQVERSGVIFLAVESVRIRVMRIFQA